MLSGSTASQPLATAMSSRAANRRRQQIPAPDVEPVLVREFRPLRADHLGREQLLVGPPVFPGPQVDVADDLLARGVQLRDGRGVGVEQIDVVDLHVVGRDSAAVDSCQSQVMPTVGFHNVFGIARRHGRRIGRPSAPAAGSGVLLVLKVGESTTPVAAPQEIVEAFSGATTHRDSSRRCRPRASRARSCADLTPAQIFATPRSAFDVMSRRRESKLQTAHHQHNQCFVVWANDTIAATVRANPRRRRGIQPSARAVSGTAPRRMQPWRGRWRWSPARSARCRGVAAG